jgi:hypothetical protein
MAEFKPKKQNIDIVYEGAIWDAASDTSQDKVLTFLDIKGYSLNGPYLCVQLHNDTQYVYPMAAVSSLKLSVSE